LKQKHRVEKFLIETFFPAGKFQKNFSPLLKKIARIPNHRQSPPIIKPFGFSLSSPFGNHNSKILTDFLVVHPFRVHDSKTALPFILRCCSTTQADFRLPIAYISPDFFLRREKIQSGRDTGPEKTLLRRFLPIPRIFGAPDFSAFLKSLYNGSVLQKEPEL
jgi:hypothetical protein